MNEWNKWDQQPQQPPQQSYSYDQFDQPSGRRGLADKVFGARMAQKLRSPLFATTAILLAGAAFAAVIMMSYPGEEGNGNVPVIVAENTDFKFEPQDRGGMNIPHQDNTIFSAVTGEEPFGEGAQVENLLDSEDDSFDKMKAVEVAEAENQESEFERLAAASEKAMQPQTEDLAEIEPGTGETSHAGSSKTVRVINIPDVTKKPAQKSDVKAIEPLAKPSQEPLREASVSEPVQEAPTGPGKLHRPGASPDTLAFVRSVLDKKDGRQAVQQLEQQQMAAAQADSDMDQKAAELAGLAPAAGAASATPGTAIGGTHYVQVVSVPSESGAESEWQKLQKAHAAELGGQGYRIQQANLGERGTYYRVQVGPMSKDAANRLCDSLKAKKSGSCLVVR